MPCASLESRISVIESNAAWHGKVVYGDTDSVFVLLDGASLSDAFRVGKEISAVVSALQLEPMKLKFEKVHSPAMLLAKKRYVGRMFEHNAHETPVIDAKAWS